MIYEPFPTKCWGNVMQELVVKQSVSPPPGESKNPDLKKDTSDERISSRSIF